MALPLEYTFSSLDLGIQLDICCQRLDLSMARNIYKGSVTRFSDSADSLCDGMKLDMSFRNAL